MTGSTFRLHPRHRRHHRHPAFSSFSSSSFSSVFRETAEPTGPQPYVPWNGVQPNRVLRSCGPSIQTSTKIGYNIYDKDVCVCLLDACIGHRYY